MCASTRLLLPALLAGIVASSLTGQPIVGWIVAGLIGGLLFLRDRRRPESFACAVAPRTTRPARSAVPGPRPDSEPADASPTDR